MELALLPTPKIPKKLKNEHAQGLKSFEALKKLLSNIKKNAKLNAQDIKQLEEVFGERVKKALESIANKKVKKYLFRPSGVVRWVVEGQECNYLVIESSFCSCKDFLFTALLKREVPACYHLLARELAEKTDKFEQIIVDDSHYLDYMEKWL